MTQTERGLIFKSWKFRFEHTISLCVPFQILFFMGAFSNQIALLDWAGKGGPLGELVQWTDLIATSYILGHDINVVLNKSDLHMWVLFVICLFLLKFW